MNTESVSKKPTDNANNTLLPAIKGGRCWNGYHNDRGRVIHSVPTMDKYSSGDWFNKALCGTKPGKRSYGWSKTDNDVNCPKCLKKLLTINCG